MKTTERVATHILHHPANFQVKKQRIKSYNIFIMGKAATFLRKNKNIA